MARYVHEIMSPALFSLEPHSPRDAGLDFLLALGISACPVIDEAGKVRGMISLRDLSSPVGGNVVGDRIFEPAVTIEHTAEVADAARKLVREHVHQLVVLDEKGRAVGLVSAVDLVAALVGEPVAHPPAFRRVDEHTGVHWLDDVPYDREHASELPQASGVLAIVYGRAGKRELPIWAEACDDLRARALSILDEYAQGPSQVAHVLERDRRHLRLRVAVVESAELREAALSTVQVESRRIRHR